MNTGQVIFVVNLLQDINIHRPLVMLAAHELKLTTRFLVTTAFRRRDKTGLWQQELDDIANATHSAIHGFGNEYQALQILQGGHGVLIAASESHLQAHAQVHDLFRIAPSQYVRITLQHGYECVGFLQSREQNLAHGANITFGADIICGWCEPKRLTAVTRSQRHKLWVTGPTSRLGQPNSHQDNAAPAAATRQPIGLVCENMHSPRLNVTGDFKCQFLDIFETFCAELAREGRQVALRPHPGGQYVIKNNVPLPDNAILENSPIYKVDLTRFAYGISAPSSILVDMVLAGIPTAVWQDEGSVMDLGNYKGLTRISNVDEWIAFAKDASRNPALYIEQQDKFLAEQRLCIDKDRSYKAFVSLFASTKEVNCQAPRITKSKIEERLLFIAPGYIPTLQLSFLKPLAEMVTTGKVLIDVLSEIHLNAEVKALNWSSEKAREWFRKRIDDFRPTIVIFCRYAGPHAKWALDNLHQANVPVIYHVDDDLLHVPHEIDPNKWAFHNRPERLDTVRYLLDHVDLVYCSTLQLKQRLEELAIVAPIHAGSIYCSAEPINPPKPGVVKKVGYMGIGHAGDLAMILPALTRYLRLYPEVDFELFGTIPIPPELEEFGHRVRKAPKIENYDHFLQTLSQYGWDIGICPLTDIPFNKLKANTKWVEYTAVGIAVIASRGTVYDDCCAGTCGILANGEDEWFNALEWLTKDHAERTAMIKRAQAKLLDEYSPAMLRNQVISIFQLAKKNRDINSSRKSPSLSRRSLSAQTQPQRILFISNNYLPTLQLSFIKPLAIMVESGVYITDFLSEEQLKKQVWQEANFASPKQWIEARFSSFMPALVVFCRYSGPHADFILDLARRGNIPAIYHIDDDLLGIPKEIGYGKYEFHNKKDRLYSVRYLLERVDLVYCSTYKLKDQLSLLNLRSRLENGKIYCSGSIINPAEIRPVVKIGYMASNDHAHNLIPILPVIIRIMHENPEIKFEFFGSIPISYELEAFGDRVGHTPAIANYEEFLQEFSKNHWDVGLCPLTAIHFNLMKANTKWVEYTSVGTAVVASRGTVYDECCAEGCGLLATTEEEWYSALSQLIRDPRLRYEQVRRAQEKLEREYSLDRLRQQVMDMFELARKIHLGKA